MNNIKLKIYIYIVNVHRYIFDNLYVQDYIITKKDKMYILYYNLLCSLFPNFRWELKNNYIYLKKKYDEVGLNKKEQKQFYILIEHNVVRYTEKDA